MKTRSVLGHLQIGRIWFLLPLLGALTALVLLASWPDVFSESLDARADAPATVVAFEPAGSIADFAVQVVA